MSSDVRNCRCYQSWLGGSWSANLLRPNLDGEQRLHTEFAYALLLVLHVGGLLSVKRTAKMCLSKDCSEARSNSDRCRSGRRVFQAMFALSPSRKECRPRVSFHPRTLAHPPRVSINFSFFSPSPLLAPHRLRSWSASAACPKTPRDSNSAASARLRPTIASSFQPPIFSYYFIMVYSITYARPRSDGDIRNSTSSEASAETKQRSLDDSIRSCKSCPMTNGIPEALSFDRIMNGGVCPVCLSTLDWLRVERLNLHIGPSNTCRSHVLFAIS